MNKKGLVFFVTLFAVMLAMTAAVSTAEANTCSHENTFEALVWINRNNVTYVSINNSEHSATGECLIAVICTDCWTEVSRSENVSIETVTESHRYVNGICERCGHQNTCKHENTDNIMEWADDNLVYEPINSIFHQVTGESNTYAFCFDCGEVLSPVENLGVITLEEPHDYLDGICRQCGYKNTCSHENTYETWRWASWNSFTYEPFDEKTHNATAECYTYIVCGDCGTELSRSEKTSLKTVQYNHYFIDGICRDCGYSSNPCSHEKTEDIPGKAATCTETGLTAGKKCSVCGKVLVEQDVIAALGHDWDEGRITQEATPTETGKKTYTCRRCNETRTEDVQYEPKSDPKYTINDTAYDRDAMLLTGTVQHDVSTDAADKVFARITFFMSDGTFVAFATVIDEEGNFEAMASGDIIHIAVQVTDSTKVRPGQFSAFGGSEFDVE